MTTEITEHTLRTDPHTTWDHLVGLVDRKLYPVDEYPVAVLVAWLRDRVPDHWPARGTAAIAEARAAGR